MRLAATALLLLLGACRVPNVLPILSAPPEPPFPEGWTVLDLTRPLDKDAPFVPHAEAFPFERVDFLKVRDTGWRTGGYSGTEHMGTHVASSLARLPVGDPVQTIPGAQLLLPVVVIDCPDAAKAGGAVTAADVQADERAHGAVPAGSIVLLRTGRGALASSDPLLLGRRSDGSVSFPGWNDDAVRDLALERRVRAVGTDTMAVDPGSRAREAPAQSAGSAAGLWFVAGLADLSRLPQRGALLVVGAIPLVGAAGAPARVLALVPPR